MIAPSSEARLAVELVRGRRGAVLAIVALCLIVLLGATGLAIDLGRGYLTRARIARAVDAGALAAAKVLREGEAAARDEALSVARANGIADGADGVTTAIQFGLNARGESTVLFTARRELPTSFMRVMGYNLMPVSATAEAAIAPLDVVLVLDTSNSLHPSMVPGAWTALVTASQSFASFFRDGVDQMGLVSFQTVAGHRVQLRSDFTTPVNNAINALAPFGGTNIQEGLRLAQVQITGPSARPSAAKAVVFFTDGRASSLRANNVGTAPFQDRIIQANTLNRVWGFLNNAGSLNVNVDYTTPNGCSNVANCNGATGPWIMTEAGNRGLEWARAIRQEGALLYAIGLGNPAITDPILVPDQDYLRRVANEGGIDNPAHPEGRMYFAPSAAQLEAVFNEVARDLIVRLAR